MAPPPTRHQLRMLGLCSGIGGFDLGLAGVARAVCHLEREAFAVAHLVAAMQAGALAQAPIWSDATTFDGRPWRGRVDLVAGGIPCQPHSTAGRHGGLDDPRDLTRQVIRILRETSAPLLFLENVPPFRRRGLPRLLEGLAELGFDAEWAVFSAAGVGAPHLRRRLLVLAATNTGRQLLRAQQGRLEPGRTGAAEPRDDGAARPDPDPDRRGLEELGLPQPPRVPGPPGGQPHGLGEDGELEHPETLADAHVLRRHEALGHDAEGEPDSPGSRETLANPSSSRLPLGQGEPGDHGPELPTALGSRWWATEPDVGRVAHGIPARVDRLRALGNAVVPAVVRAAWEHLVPRILA